MNCIDYKEFYSILAPIVLTLLSIFIAVIVFNWQRRSEKQGEIEKDIESLVKSINNFNAIFDHAVPFIYTRLPDTEYRELIQDLIAKYYDWKNRNQDYMSFLNKLNLLQNKIHSDLIHKLGRFEERDIYNRDYHYAINISNYEFFMNDVYPFLDKTEGIYTSIFGIVIDNKKNWFDLYRGREDDKEYLSGFYEKYWDILIDIRENAIDIDKKMYVYKQNIFNSILDSKKSIRYLYAAMSLVFAFGLLIPLYMIQPNKFGILSCDCVFYITIISFIISVICIYMSHLKRHKYETVAEE